MPMQYVTQDGAPVTYIQEGMPGMPMQYVTQEGMPMMYAAPQPMVYNISPEIFARIASGGGAMTQDEINDLMGAPAQPVMPMGTTMAAPTMAASPAATTAKSSSKDKSSKKMAKVSKKKSKG